MSARTVSVIVPVYNAGKWLREALDSVLSQTHRDLEVICVDDGSTDDSPAILAEYAAADPRVRVLTQKNQGAGAARNAALDAATGGYVCFFDPDDLYPSSDTIAKLVSAAESSGCEIAGGRLERFWDAPDGRIAEPGGDPFPHLGRVAYRDYQSPYWYYCYIYPRALLEREHLRFPPYRRFQDPPFFIRAMLAAGEFHAIGDVVYRWRVNHKQVDFDGQKCKLLNEHLQGALEVLKLADEHRLGKLFYRLAKQSLKMVSTFDRLRCVRETALQIARLVRRSDALLWFRKRAVLRHALKYASWYVRLFMWLRPYACLKRHRDGWDQLVKNIQAYWQNRRISREAKGFKYVHIMHNDKFNKPFVDFLNRHFSPDEHLVICRKRLDFPLPEGRNVRIVGSYRGLDFSSDSIKKVYCHSLLDCRVVDWLYCHKRMLCEKTWWIVWGADLYNARRDRKNDFVRGHFCGYWAGTDYRLIQERYGAGGININIAYQFPIRKDMLDSVINARVLHSGNIGRIRVQINNSCDSSTIPMLKILAKYRGNGIIVRTIVSYGKMDCKADVLRVGQELFGDDFEAIESYMSPMMYARKLDEIDILILNQSRQQGVGNTLAAMYLGKKVFLRSDVSTFMLNDMGAKIFDTLDICALPFDKFKESDPEFVAQNHSFSNAALDDACLVVAYRHAFNINSVEAPKPKFRA